MIISGSLNLIIDFFDSILGSSDLDLALKVSVDFLGHGVYLIGTATYATFISVVLFFIGIKLIIAPVQWIWERIPFN